MIVETSNIPAQLRALPQWVAWRYVERKGRLTKMPYQCDGTPADSTDPSTWASFGAVLEASGFDGIGFVFAPDGGMVGIDLDKALHEDGTMKGWARGIVSRFATYAEVSPSGRGLKLWALGRMPGDGKGRRGGYRDGEIEMYGSARYFTVTGIRLDESAETIEPRQQQINGLFEHVFTEETPALLTRQTPPVMADDQKIIDHLLGEAGGKAARLWSGDHTGYLSESEADAALCAKIAFYVGNDAGRIERIFNQSMLVRGKWIDRADYRSRTIEGAIGKVGKFYDWNRQAIAPLMPPPSNTNAFDKLIDETIRGERRNESWPWDLLTRGARALMPGATTVICGGSGSTKSMLVSDASLYWLEHNTPFAVFHLEEDREFHQLRALAQLAGDSRVTNDEWMRKFPDAMNHVRNEHRPTLTKLGECIWDAPDNIMTPDGILDWMRDRAKEGRRIIVVDPVTAINTGEKNWVEDMKIVLTAKKIMRDYRASFVAVTHPRNGAVKSGTNIDNIAGGQAWNRFTQNVLWLDRFNDTHLLIEDVAGGTQVTANRLIKIRKARSGPMQGAEIALYFHRDTLRFTELGIVKEDDK